MGPFETGTQGTTKQPGQPPRTWKLVDVKTPERAVIEMELPGAVLRFTWTFEELEDDRTRLTQRIVLEGDFAEQYRTEVEAGFAPNIGPGMQKIARDMARQTEGGT